MHSVFFSQFPQNSSLPFFFHFTKEGRTKYNEQSKHVFTEQPPLGKLKSNQANFEKTWIIFKNIFEACILSLFDTLCIKC